MNGAYSGLASIIRNLLVAGGSVVLLAGCMESGSGDGDTATRTTYGGNERQATVSSSGDAAVVAYASTEGVYQAIKSETTDLPTAALIESAGVEDALTADLLRIIAENDQLNVSPAVANLAAGGSCGGEIRYEGDEVEEIPENGTLNLSYTYEDYCVAVDGGEVVTDGSGDYSATYENKRLTEYAMTWSLTYTVDDGEAIDSALQGTTRCEGINSAAPTCSYSEDFVGPNGKSYRVDNVSVNQDANGNYGVSARVYDTDLGYVDFEASDINNDCNNGNFSGGTATIRDSSGEVVVEVRFTNCNDGIVTFNGVSEEYEQPDRT